MFLAAAVAEAQRAAWSLQPGEAAIFHVEARLLHQSTDATHRRMAFPGVDLPQPPLLLASELDPARQRLTADPMDLRDLVRCLASDLRQWPGGGKCDQVLPAVSPFGEFTLTGAWQAVDADGAQIGSWQLAAKPVLGRKRGEVGPEPTDLGAEGKGSLRIARRFDAGQGVLQCFTVELQLLGKPCRRYGDCEQAEVQLHSTWTFDRVVHHRDLAQQQRIDEAVARGAAWLRHEVAIPNRREFDPQRERSAGTLAIVLLTLVAAEVPVDDAVVRQGLDELCRREIRQTYELALALAALERAHAPARERDLLISRQIEHPTPRVLPREQFAVLHGWVERLLANRDDSVDAAYRSRWRYEGGPGYDNSNTQYALLGLRSAALCGEHLSRGIWHAAAAHWLEGGKVEGEPRPLVLTHHVEAKGQQLTDVRRRSSRPVQPRGWSYDNVSKLAYGNMTSAAISSLVLCREGLLTDDKGRPLEPGRAGEQREALQDIDAAIDAGFAWWSAHRPVRFVASRDRQSRFLHYYYGLYGLERACELAGVAWIDDWDWYWDGAHVLVLDQDPDGSFGRDVVDTCFSLLFLKKAQLPVLTGPRQR